jgi:hypothetical protein
MTPPFVPARYKLGASYVRSAAKQARSSAVNSAGCSNAAKWPLRGTRFQ